MKTKPILTIAALGLAGGALALAVGCARATAANDTTSASAARPISTAAVEAAATPIVHRATGTIEAGRPTPRAFTSGGLLAELPLRPGQSFRAGEVLARLDLTERRAQVAQAQAALDKARRDATRVATLAEAAVATTEQRQDAQTALAVAEAALVQARFHLDKAALVAPSDGLVLRQLAEPGQMVAPGQPVYLVAYNDEPWRVVAQLPGAALDDLVVGDVAQIYPRGGEAVVGQVTRFRPTTAGGTGLAEIEINLPAGDWREGTPVVVEITTGQVARELLVPTASVVEVERGRGIAYRVRQNRAERIVVHLGQLREGRLAIAAENLAAGDRVAVDGAGFLTDGQTVTEATPR